MVVSRLSGTEDDTEMFFTRLMEVFIRAGNISLSAVSVAAGSQLSTRTALFAPITRIARFPPPLQPCLGVDIRNPSAPAKLIDAPRALHLDEVP